MKKSVGIHGIVFKLLISICSLCCFVALFGCNEEQPPVTEGIVITDNGVLTYSDATISKAKDTIFTFMKTYYQTAVFPTVPDSTLTELMTQAEEIQEVTLRAGLYETEYCKLLSLLEENGEELAAEIHAYQTGQSITAPYPLAKRIYTDLSHAIGAEGTGRLLYHLLLYVYDIQYETQMRRYEEYGYSYLLSEAEQLDKDRQTLIGDIGEDNLITALKTVFMLAELFFGGGLESDTLRGFTDREILVLLEHAELDRLAVNDEGWELLLRLLAEALSVDTESAYGAQLLAAAENNGDLTLLSGKMDDLVALLSAVKASLTENDIGHLRSGEYEALFAGIFKKFGEDEWSLFESITETPLTHADYETIAGELFGEVFSTYADSVVPITLTELRSAVTEEDFREKLVSYVAGISPAFSYILWKESSDPVAEQG